MGNKNFNQYIGFTFNLRNKNDFTPFDFFGTQSDMNWAVNIISFQLVMFLKWTHVQKLLTINFDLYYLCFLTAINCSYTYSKMVLI